MSNPLYQSMKPQSNNPMQMLRQLRQNPIQFITKRGFNLPQNIGNNPNDIIQHLMNTGQISQNRYNQVMQNLQNMRK